ncbi:WD40-repeat-containing domain protein, partial [Dichotomopilus funicola]
PKDTISALRWSPTADHLAASSWDGQAYIYDVTNSACTASIKALTSIPVGTPVLDCDFSTDGCLVAAAGSDNAIHVMDLQSGETRKLEAHTLPVRAVRFFPRPWVNNHLLASASWDKTVLYWDLRQPKPIGVFQLPDRVFAMDVAESLLAAATADRHIHFVDLGNPTQPRLSHESPLKYHTASISVSRDGCHAAVGGVDGRAAAYHGLGNANVNEVTDFTYKCHRSPDTNKGGQTNVYAVNAVSYYPVNHDILATAGSDGTFAIWDVKNHSAVEKLRQASGPITALSFARDGKALAYAVGHDWAKGVQHYPSAAKPEIVLHKFGGTPGKK